MDIYKIIKWATRIKSMRLKLFGVWVAHITGRRYYGVFIDPVMACNLKCHMCYMSDSDERRKVNGSRFSQSDIPKISASLFSRALKLQIGCSTEPTIYRYLPDIVKEGKDKGVSYISITTNGQLLSSEMLLDLVSSGLNEVTLSLHGVVKPTYERLMEGAKFERLLSLIDALVSVRQRFPGLRVRINYTMNSDNTEELSGLPELLHGLKIDVLQLRPVQRLGKSVWSDFSLDRIRELYPAVVLPLINYYRGTGSTVVAPELKHLSELESDPNGDESSALEEFTYIYVSPDGCGSNMSGFDPLSETFQSYCRRVKRSKQILKCIVKGRASGIRKGTKKMNYAVK